jgi:hypothetical protein
MLHGSGHANRDTQFMGFDLPSIPSGSMRTTNPSDRTLVRWNRTPQKNIHVRIET